MGKLYSQPIRIEKLEDTLQILTFSTLRFFIYSARKLLTDVYESSCNVAVTNNSITRCEVLRSVDDIKNCIRNQEENSVHQPQRQ